MKYIIWGAGGLLSDLNEKRILNTRALEKISHFVDSDSGKWDTVHHGKPVTPPETLLSENSEDLKVIIGVKERYSEIELRLRKMGISNYAWIITFNGDENIPSLIRRMPWFVLADAFYADERWIDRAEIAMELVSWDGKKSMLDLGAGIMLPKKFLPEGVSYTPVDYTQSDSEAVVCDFNKHEFPSQTADVVYAVGVLGYLNDWKWFLEKAAGAVNKGGCLIVSAGVSNKRQALYSHHTSFALECDVILCLQECGFILRNYKDWNTHTRIMIFEEMSKHRSMIGSVIK